LSAEQNEPGKGRVEEKPGEAAAETAAGPPAEPEAGPREIAAGIVVLAVMLGGFAYTYHQGLETGLQNGRQEALEGIPPWADRLKDGRLVGGMTLSDGQQFLVRIAGPGDAVQDERIPAVPGDRVAVVVLPGPGGPPEAPPPGPPAGTGPAGSTGKSEPGAPAGTAPPAATGSTP